MRKPKAVAEKPTAADANIPSEPAKQKVGLKPAPLTQLTPLKRPQRRPPAQLAKLPPAPVGIQGRARLRQNAKQAITPPKLKLTVGRSELLPNRPLPLRNRRRPPQLIADITAA